MKISVSINLFDGEELLRANLINKRKFAFHVSVVYQKYSYYNTKHPNDNLEELLNSLVKEGLIDEYYLFAPILSLKPNQNEMIKRNIGLDLAKKSKAIYYMNCDCDEFFKEEDIKIIINYYNEHNLDFACCPLIDYYEINLRNKYPRDMTCTAMPLLIKITDNLLSIGCIDYVYNAVFNTYIHPKQNKLKSWLFIKYCYYVQLLTKILFPSFLNKIVFQHNTLRIDSTRIPIFKEKTIKTHIFSSNEILMHHMFLVRKDLNLKINNSSNSKKYTEEQIQNYLKNKNSDKKDDFFSIVDNIFEL